MRLWILVETWTDGSEFVSILEDDEIRSEIPGIDLDSNITVDDLEPLYDFRAKEKLLVKVTVVDGPAHSLPLNQALRVE